MKLYPRYASNPLYVSSESYGGHFVPELATRILAGNRRATGASQLNFHGILVGDGWVNPLVSSSTYAEYAYAHGLVDLTQKAHVDALYQDCFQEIVNTLPTPSRKADEIWWLGLAHEQKIVIPPHHFTSHTTSFHVMWLHTSHHIIPHHSTPYHSAPNK